MIIKLLYNSDKKIKNYKKNNKFCSFLQNSILPKRSRDNFPFVMRNDKLVNLRYRAQPSKLR